MLNCCFYAATSCCYNLWIVDAVMTTHFSVPTSARHLFLARKCFENVIFVEQGHFSIHLDSLLGVIVFAGVWCCFTRQIKESNGPRSVPHAVIIIFRADRASYTNYILVIGFLYCPHQLSLCECRVAGLLSQRWLNRSLVWDHSMDRLLLRFVQDIIFTVSKSCLPLWLSWWCVTAGNTAIIGNVSFKLPLVVKIWAYASVLIECW